MKKTTDVKFPHSANLFQFCRRVLDHKFGGIRVIDQDVGQILGFDPADCSHWKKGKKNIRSIQAMKSIAEHLGVDDKLVVDIASGEIDEEEAFFEYSGYGAFDIDSKVLENARKDLYRRNASTWTREKELEFATYFAVDHDKLNQVAKAVHEKINFTEAPLYLPEIIAVFPKLQLKALDNLEAKDSTSVTIKKENDVTVISYRSGTEIRPYVRYQIARGMAQYFLNTDNSRLMNDLSDYAKHLADVQSNLFAAKLLTPAKLIRKEMTGLNVAKDIVSQLSETFWVSKTFMNRRLKDILQHNPEL